MNAPGRSGASAATITLGDRFARQLQHHRDSALAALRELLASPLASLLTILVMAIALALPAMLGVALKNLQGVTGQWDDAAQISLFLKPEVDVARAEAMRQRLEKHPGVASVRLIDKEAALAEFRQRSGFGETLEQLDNNPLPNLLVLTPVSREPEAAERLLAGLKGEAEVDLAQLDIAWVRRLSAILDLGARALGLIALALGLGVLLVTGNTIRLAVQNRREEIEVQKLVGATNRFIRRPFLYTGFLQGALAGLAAWAMVGGALTLLQAPVAALAGLYASRFQLAGLSLAEALALILMAGVLGLLGAWLSVSRHLHAIEPR